MFAGSAARAFVLGVLLIALAACSGPTQRLVYAERFCYRTLAEVDCHAEPLPAEAFREVGWFDQPILVTVED